MIVATGSNVLHRSCSLFKAWTMRLARREFNLRRERGPWACWICGHSVWNYDWRRVPVLCSGPSEWRVHDTCYLADRVRVCEDLEEQMTELEGEANFECARYQRHIAALNGDVEALAAEFAEYKLCEERAMALEEKHAQRFESCVGGVSERRQLVAELRFAQAEFAQVQATIFSRPFIGRGAG